MEHLRNVFIYQLASITDAKSTDDSITFNLKSWACDRLQRNQFTFGIEFKEFVGSKCYEILDSFSPEFSFA